MDTDLVQKHCIPCEGGVPPMTPDDVKNLQSQIPTWVVSDDNKKISRTFLFKDFAKTMDFANRITAIAEEEQHHPDLHISYGKISVELWTHAIGGLSENDFIVAAKIDRLL